MNLPQIGAIAAMTTRSVIGINNDIPWHYPEDSKRFKRVTLGGAIIMGRKTWESIGSKPLPGRRNIVISRNQIIRSECYSNILNALEACESDENPIWFIGGGQIYTAALPYCSHLDITIVPDEIDSTHAVLFPDINEQHWKLESSTPLKSDPRLNIQTFSRMKPCSPENG